MNTRQWLIRLYPQAWRDRYGEEFDALLEQCLHSPLDALDILLGALDAHMQFSHEMNWRLMNVVNKLRTSILLVFTGYVGFILGGMSLYGLVDDSPAAALMKTDHALFTAWNVVEAGALIALLAIVIGGLPLALAAMRRAFTSSRRDLLYLLVPVIAFVALILYAGFMALIAAGRLQIPGVLPAVSPDNFPIGNRLLIGGGMAVFVLGAIASTAAVWKILTNSNAEGDIVKVPGLDTPTKVYSRAFSLAVVASIAMLLMLGSTLAFGWMAHSTLPDWFAGDQGLLLTSTTGSFVVIVLVMALSTALALFGVARGFSARSDVQAAA